MSTYFLKNENIIKVKNLSLLLWIALLGMSNSLLVSCKSMAQKQSADAVTPTMSSTKCSTAGAFPLEIVPSEGVKLTPAESKKGPQLPLKYTVYTINNEQMQAFFKSIQSTGQGSINLPVPGHGCQSFYVENSGTMSAELAAKFPEIISLKGMAQHDKAGYTRIDYDGKKLKVEITWDNEIYYVQPWEEKGQLWYVLSDKRDTGYEKQPFE